jgi:hypothetical protein
VHDSWQAGGRAADLYPLELYPGFVPLHENPSRMYYARMRPAVASGAEKKEYGNQVLTFLLESLSPRLIEMPGLQRRKLNRCRLEKLCLLKESAGYGPDHGNKFR